MEQQQAQRVALVELCADFEPVEGDDYRRVEGVVTIPLNRAFVKTLDNRFAVQVVRGAVFVFRSACDNEDKERIYERGKVCVPSEVPILCHGKITFIGADSEGSDLQFYVNI